MQTQYFERPEGTLAYSDYGGNGQLVLMLPGMGALRSEYRYLAPKLAQAGYHAVTVDLRGHGESSVPWKTYDVPSVGNDILALIEHLNASSAHVIGTSFSPSAAVWAAAECPDRIRSLVLISPFVRAVKINPIMQVCSCPLQPCLEHKRLWFCSGFLAQNSRSLCCFLRPNGTQLVLLPILRLFWFSVLEE